MPKYILVDSDNIASDVFENLSTKEVLDRCEESFEYDALSSMRKLTNGFIKIYRVNEVEVSIPSIPEMKFKVKSNG